MKVWGLLILKFILLLEYEIQKLLKQLVVWYNCSNLLFWFLFQTFNLWYCKEFLVLLLKSQYLNSIELKSTPSYLLKLYLQDIHHFQLKEKIILDIQGIHHKWLRAWYVWCKRIVLELVAFQELFLSKLDALQVR